MIGPRLSPVSTLIVALAGVILIAGVARAPTTTTRTIHVDCVNTTGIEDGAAHDHHGITQDPSADIAITGISPNPVDRGQTVTIACRVTNTGTTPRAFEVFLRMEEAASGQIVYEGWMWPGTLDPDESQTVVFEHTIPGYWAFGSYLALARVWFGGSLLGSSQGYFSVMHLREGWPWVQSVSPDPVTIGQVATITCQIYSNGSYPTTFDLAVDIAQYGEFKANVALVTTDVMYPGDLLTMTLDYTIPGDWPPGRYEVHIGVCPGAPIPDCTSNWEWREFTIRAPVTIHVDCANTTGVEDGTEANPFNTIQKGIDAAFDGDSVVVQPCTYYENTDFLGKAITVTSTDPLDPATVAATVIDGSDAGSVVTFNNGEGQGSVLTGFTIRNGLAVHGGAVYCGSSSPTIIRNTIRDNHTQGITYGGGGTVHCTAGSSAIIADNTITGNTADWGGAIGCLDSSPTITGNTMSGNIAFEGGGVSCYGGSPTVSDNTITGNTAGQWGGGIRCWNSSPAIASNTITANSAQSDGGGIWCYQSSPTISHNVITRNSAGQYGGGIECYQSSPTISHNVITRNSAVQCGGGIACGYTEISSPTIAANTISENSAAVGGGIHCAQSSSTVSNNTITANTASQYGGGISMCFTSWPTLSNNTIVGNSALEDGGGIWCLAECAPAVSNNIVALNSSGIWQADGTPTLRNNCVYNPDGYDYSGLDQGEGDISADPLFVDFAGGDYHLTAGSPCIDAGWNDALGLPDTDMDGDARPYPVDGVTDIGADEWVASPLHFHLRGGNWHLITLPGRPADDDPWQVFDELRPPNKSLDLLSGVLYRYDAGLQGYVAYQQSSPTEFGPVTPGHGYWLWLYDDETISYDVLPWSYLPVVDLEQAGWHMVGSPHPAHAALADTSWQHAGLGPHPFSMISQPGETLWAQDPLYCWSPSILGYLPCGLPPHDDDQLRAFRGYWLYTFVDDVTLEVPVP